MLKRLFIVLGGVSFIAFVASPVLWGVSARIIGGVVDDGTPLARIDAAEPPRDDDTSMARLLELAEAVTWEAEEGCPRDALEQQALDRCEEVLADHAAVLARFLAWAEDPGPFGPRQLEALGNHSRAPVGVSITTELPPLTPTLRLADLAGIAAGAALAAGRADEGVRLLHAMLDLGRFFERNPATLLHEMVGVALTNKAVRAAASLVPPARAAEVAAWLPTDAERLHNLRLAYGSEWLSLGRFLETELEKTDGPFAVTGGGGGGPPIDWSIAKGMGLYDPVHTRRLHDRFWLQLVDSVRAPPLLGPPIEFEGWEAMGPIKWVHNPIGRILFSIAVPSFNRFAGRVGDSMDRVAALRIVLAARRFFADHQRWPASEADLVPAHLSAWPTSALSLGALPWDPAKGLVRLFDEEDGTTVCTSADCTFTFAVE